MAGAGSPGRRVEGRLTQILWPLACDLEFFKGSLWPLFEYTTIGGKDGSWEIDKGYHNSLGETGRDTSYGNRVNVEREDKLQTFSR